MDSFFFNLIIAVSYGVVLFLIAAGLSLVLGVMGIVNLAHGALFVVGGFFGIAAAHASQSLLLGVIVGGLCAGVAGLIIERGFLRHLYQQPLQQILLTFGFVYIITDLLLWYWGASPRAAYIPSYFSGSVSVFERYIPLHRFAVVVLGFLVFGGLWWVQDKTRVGAIIRAGMDDAEMLGGMGVNLAPINAAIFFLGSAVAGAGAVVGAQLFGSIAFNDGFDMLIIAIVVVVIGGVGSVQGTMLGALFVGLIDTFGRIYFPQFAQYTVYVALILTLVVRPAGFMGRGLR